MINSIKTDFLESQAVLDKFLANPDYFEKIKDAGKLMVQAILSNHKLISCGNGGSMCDAMHFAEELTGLFQKQRKALPAVAISDPSHLACVANDFGYEYVFPRYVEGLGQNGDVLLAISTSGNSTNVINAAISAKLKGIPVVGLTGKDGGKLAELCDVEIRVPHAGYSDRIQEIHIKIIHALIHYIESNI